MVLTHSVSLKAKMIFTLRTKPWSHKSLSNISCWRICEQSFVPLHPASFLLLINAFTVKNLILLTELCTCSSFISFSAKKFCRRLQSVAPVCTWRQWYTQCSQTVTLINLKLSELCSRGRVKQKYLSFFHTTSLSFYKYWYCIQNKSTPATNLWSKKLVSNETGTWMTFDHFSDISRYIFNILSFYTYCFYIYMCVVLCVCIK